MYREIVTDHAHSLKNKSPPSQFRDAAYKHLRNNESFKREAAVAEALSSNARELLIQGAVLVNGEVETRRGRQVRPGDTVSVGGETVRVIGSGPESL